MDNEAITQGIKDAVDEADKELLKRVFVKILELTDIETKYNAVNDTKRYMDNLLSPIMIWTKHETLARIVIAAKEAKER